MTPQQKLQAALNRSGIPAKEIKVYGSQIVVTCWSRGSAEKWAGLLARFAKVRGIVKSVDYAKDQAAAYKRLNNPGLVISSIRHDVWLVGAFIPSEGPTNA